MRLWWSAALMTWRTGSRTVLALRQHRLGRLAPVAALLMLWAALLWLMSSVAPLAPFVYSLF